VPPIARMSQPEFAVATGADVFLLDEPTSGLDQTAANEFSRLLLRLRERGATVLMATHDLYRAKAIGDRLAILSTGRLMTVVQTAAIEYLDLESLYLQMAGCEAPGQTKSSTGPFRTPERSAFRDPTRQSLRRNQAALTVENDRARRKSSGRPITASESGSEGELIGHFNYSWHADQHLIRSGSPVDVERVRQVLAAQCDVARTDAPARLSVDDRVATHAHRVGIVGEVPALAPYARGQRQRPPRKKRSRRSWPTLATCSAL
jgi:energy-coupling factor transporter ATP-binding protein EcfA2